MSDTREIEHILVPNTKLKSHLWKHFNLLEQKADGRTDADVAVCIQCNSVVELAEGTSNMLTHMKRHHPLLLLVRISRYTGFFIIFLAVFGHRIPVRVPVRLLCTGTRLRLPSPLPAYLTRTSCLPAPLC